MNETDSWRVRMSVYGGSINSNWGCPGRKEGCMGMQGVRSVVHTGSLKNWTVVEFTNNMIITRYELTRYVQVSAFMYMVLVASL